MGRLLLLFGTFLIGLLYLFIPSGGKPYDFFPFSDVSITFANHIYLICEKLAFIILAYVVVTLDDKYRNAVQVFFWLSFADLVDYCLTYSSVWVDLNGFPVSMNTTKSLIFGIVILNELWKQRTLSRP